MAKLYDNACYFFNDLYDDEIIHDKSEHWRSKLYHDVLEGKEWIQNNRVINGDVADVTIRPLLNDEYGVRHDSYSIPFRVNVVPFYSEKAFFDHYEYGTVITNDDIMKDNKTFGKNIYFYIGQYFVRNIKLVVNRMGESYLFIEPNDTTLTAADIQSVIDDRSNDGLWTILFSTKSDYYEAYQTRYNLFEENKVYMDKFYDSHVIKRKRKNNCYTAYVSISRSSDLMVATNVSLKRDVNGEYFEFPQEFIDSVLYRRSVFTIRCFIINEPDCSGTGIYINIEDNIPVFRIPYEEHPVPVGNLLIWEYDHDTHQKYHPLVPSTEITYPNIYDFSDMYSESYYDVLYTSGKELVLDSVLREIIFTSSKSSKVNYDLYVEWIEPTEDISIFDSYIEDYIDYCDQEIDDYVQLYMDRNLPEIILNYKPTSNFKWTSMDYYTSPYRGDYRAWKRDQITQIMKDNPKRYDDIYNKLYYETKKYVTRSYDVTTDAHIYDRTVMNVREQIDVNEYSYQFQEPHCYIRFYDCNDRLNPISLYIDGKFTLPTIAIKYGTTTYVYFKKSLILDRPPIQIDMELMNEQKFSYDFTIRNIYHKIDLQYAPIDHRKISLSDLFFYDKATGEYIDKDNFKFYVQLSVARVRYIGSNTYIEDDEITYDEELVLYDSNEALFIPSDREYVILAHEEFVFEFDSDNVNIYDGNGELVEDEVLQNKFSNMEVQKRISSKNIMFGLKDTHLLYRTLTVASGDFYQQKILNLTSRSTSESIEVILYDANHDRFVPTDFDRVVLKATPGTETTSLTFNNFVGKPSPYRFRVFANGKRYHPNEYQFDFNTSGDIITIDFNEPVQEGYIVMQYIGFDEVPIYNGPISTLKKTSDNILYLNDYLITPYNKFCNKVFINGLRVSDSYIRTLGQGNMIYISPSFEFSDDDQITIYYQDHDDDPFEYDPSDQFFDQLTIEDEGFRNYLIDKYTQFIL